MTSSYLEKAAELAELAPFLTDGRANVREMAAEGVAGYTATPEGTAALSSCVELYPRLVALCKRATEATCAGAAAHAAAACVNLSQMPSERPKLLEAGAVGAAAVCVAVESPPELGEYAGMLLCNMTSLGKGVEQVVDAGVAPRLLRLLATAPLGEERHAHLALTLTNVAQNAQGRAQLLKAAAEAQLLRPLCDRLAGNDATRRLGVARLLRNLCFAAKPAAEDEPAGGALAEARATLLAEATLRPLIVRLAARLSPAGASYDADDRANFVPELAALVVTAEAGGAEGGKGGPSQPASAAAHRETQMEARLALTEALVLLSASQAARQAMRELGIYPCLRDAHLLEEDAEGVPTPVQEANENLVELFYLSQEACGPPPSQPDDLHAPTEALAAARIATTTLDGPTEALDSARISGGPKLEEVALTWRGADAAGDEDDAPPKSAGKSAEVDDDDVEEDAPLLD